MSTIRLADINIISDSIVDGEGLRTVLWVQGCNHRCEGCHNPSTHDYNKGKVVDIDVIANELSKTLNYNDLTISGGEPFDQPEELLELINRLKVDYNFNGNIWVYTGYLLDDILINEKKYNLLKEIDVLVDGRFEKNKRVYDIPFKGSRNQRIIDIPKSLENHRIELYIPL